MSDCLIERNFLDKEIDSLGESVTVRIVTKASFSKWGDATETTSDTTSVKCFINFMSQEDEEVKEGIFKVGDIRFWFKGNQTINRGDRIQYDSKWYEVDNILPLIVAGTTLAKDVRVSKI
jgi:head-tail adaptor